MKYLPAIPHLVTKIERWRFFAIEMSILTKSSGRIQVIHEIVHDLEGEKLFSNSIAVMQVLCKVALGDHDEAWILHHSFSGLGHF